MKIAVCDDCHEDAMRLETFMEGQDIRLYFDPQRLLGFAPAVFVNTEAPGYGIQILQHLSLLSISPILPQPKEGFLGDIFRRFSLPKPVIAVAVYLVI